MSKKHSHETHEQEQQEFQEEQQDVPPDPRPELPAADSPEFKHFVMACGFPPGTNFNDPALLIAAHTLVQNVLDSLIPAQ